MVESLESRILIGREPLLKFFKGGTLMIENLCQLMNFGLILSHGGCYIITGPSGCLLDYNRGGKGCWYSPMYWNTTIAKTNLVSIAKTTIVSSAKMKLSVVQRWYCQKCKDDYCQYWNTTIGKTTIVSIAKTTIVSSAKMTLSVVQRRLLSVLQRRLLSVVQRWNYLYCKDNYCQYWNTTIAKTTIVNIAKMTLSVVQRQLLSVLK